MLETYVKNAGSKLNALFRQCKILPFHKRKLLMNSFFDSQFAYCPLVWMCHGRRMNNKINNLLYRALRTIHRDEHSTFDELLSRDNSVTIHHRNIRTLAVEMYKIQQGLSPEFMNDIFPKRELSKIESVAGNTRNQNHFYNPVNPKTISWGLEALRPKGMVCHPNDIKESSTLEKFKAIIKKWKPTDYPCKLCKIYIQSLGHPKGRKNCGKKSRGRKNCGINYCDLAKKSQLFLPQTRSSLKVVLLFVNYMLFLIFV